MCDPLCSSDEARGSDLLRKGESSGCESSLFLMNQERSDDLTSVLCSRLLLKNHHLSHTSLSNFSCTESPCSLDIQSDNQVLRDPSSSVSFFFSRNKDKGQGKGGAFLNLWSRFKRSVFKRSVSQSIMSDKGNEAKWLLEKERVTLLRFLDRDLKNKDILGDRSVTTLRMRNQENEIKWLLEKEKVTSLRLLLEKEKKL